MAVASKKKKKTTKKKSIPITLFDVCLSYPELHDPKPFKGKTYYRVDAIMESDSEARLQIRKAVKQIATAMWGTDETEWPKENIQNVQNGNKREDQQGYSGKFFITAKTQNPVPVVDLRGKAFKPQGIRGGMFGNVAITVAHWEFDGDEGIALYLNGVQIDTEKESLNFGGGRSVKQMFNMDDVDEDEDMDEDMDDEDEDDSDDEDEKPARRSKKKKPSRDEDEDSEEDDDLEEDEDDEDEKPARRSKKKTTKKRPSRDEDEDSEEDDDSDFDDEDEPPRRSKKKTTKKRSRDFDDEDED